ncbi:HK97 family phage prohead protease [Methylopila sp. Yamaguchi]|uniref:HK97 family phage prohead protease n=1 Tax=Methylopila sp. Yamaguchi TaxID=1437817 RepID=UPI000CC53E40|nr:HK97 family phage prohead protease [Methylopila sp. Yamaguchi]GBD48530.1 peptidase U35 [Methylopila sp. Yamaguchi]
MERLEIKAALSVDEAGTITGIAWPFNEGPDQLGDLIAPGAFTIAPDMPMLFAHDPEDLVGIWTEVKETPEGLLVAGQLDVKERRRARAVRSLITSGQIGGLSIGYRTKAFTPRAGKGRVISALDLVEVSVVRNPAHPRARITGAKSASSALAIAEAISRAASALRI